MHIWNHWTDSHEIKFLWSISVCRCALTCFFSFGFPHFSKIQLLKGPWSLQWVQTLQNTDLWNRWTASHEIKFHWSVSVCRCALSLSPTVTQEGNHLKIWTWVWLQGAFSLMIIHSCNSSHIRGGPCITDALFWIWLLQWYPPKGALVGIVPFGGCRYNQ